MYLPQNKLAEYREKHKPKKCPIIPSRTDDWVVDHDHDTGMVRGVISRVSNSLIGKIENFLARRCSQSPKDFPAILRRVADYLDRDQEDVLHPVGLTQLTKRFQNRLTQSQQIAVLLDLGGDQESIKACSNAKKRAELFRKLTKSKYEKTK